MMKGQKCTREMMVALGIPLNNETKPGLVDLNFPLLRDLVEEEANEFDKAMSLLHVLKDQGDGWRQVVQAETLDKLDVSALGKFAPEMPDEEFHREATIFWWAEVIDAICDITFVIHNTSNAMGLDIEPYFDEVYKTNMAKAGGPVRADGKRLKPPGWRPPQIRAMLKKLLMWRAP